MNNRFRSLLVAAARAKRFGPAALSLLNAFCDAIEAGENPAEAFEKAAVATQMVGTGAAILATRMKCELLIRDAYERADLDAPIMDFMSPTLMKAFDKETGTIPERENNG